MRPNAIAAISSMRASAMKTSGTSSDDAEGRARTPRPADEIMPVPEGEHGREPGADDVGRVAEQRGLAERRAGAAPGSAARAARRAAPRAISFQWSGSTIGAAPGEFRLPRSRRTCPNRADAAFEDLPGLVDRFDDVVVDADRLGARDEVAQHRRPARGGRDWRP